MTISNKKLLIQLANDISRYATITDEFVSSNNKSQFCGAVEIASNKMMIGDKVVASFDLDERLFYSNILKSWEVIVGKISLFNKGEKKTIKTIKLSRPAISKFSAHVIVNQLGEYYTNSALNFNKNPLRAKGFDSLRSAKDALCHCPENVEIKVLKFI